KAQSREKLVRWARRNGVKAVGSGQAKGRPRGSRNLLSQRDRGPVTATLREAVIAVLPAVEVLNGRKVTYVRRDDAPRGPAFDTLLRTLEVHFGRDISRETVASILDDLS